MAAQQDFFVLLDPLSDEAARCDPDYEVESELIAVSYGRLAPTRAYRFWISQGHQRCDVLWSTLVGLILISDRVKATLARGTFSGWSTYDVHLYDSTGEAVGGYHGLSVHGRCGPFDFSRSAEVYLEFPRARVPAFRGLHIDNAAWDGSDVFVPTTGPSVRLITRTLWSALQTDLPSNLTLLPANTFTLPQQHARRGGLPPR